MTEEKKKKIDQLRLTILNIGEVGLNKIANDIVDLDDFTSIIEIMPSICKGIVKFRQKKDLMNYLQLLNLLLNSPLTNRILHSCLPELYSEIIFNLSKNGMSMQIERAKLLRKLWHGKVHPKLLSQIRKQTLKKVHFDMEVLTSIDAIEHVRGYYQTQLKMSTQEILTHLPQVRILNKKFKLLNPDPLTQYHPQLPLEVQSILTKRKREEDKDLPPINHVIDKQCQQVIKQCQQVNKQEEQKPDLNISDVQITKRTREQQASSSQTQNYSSEDDFSQQQCRVLTRQQQIEIVNDLDRYLFEQKQKQTQARNQSLKQLAIMLKDLKKMSSFECPQCGMGFLSQVNLIIHREQHVKEKLKRYKIKKGLQRQKDISLLSQVQFCKRDKIESNSDYWLIITSETERFNVIIYRECKLCGVELQLIINSVENEWKLLQAVRVRQEYQISLDDYQNQQQPEQSYKKTTSRIVYMHFKCMQFLRMKQVITQD